MHLNTSTILTGAVLASLTFASSASGKDFDFRYAKTDLLSHSGAVNIYHRIYDFSGILCEHQFKPPYAVKSRSIFERCVRRTVKEMVKKISHPSLDRVYQAKLILRQSSLKARPKDKKIPDDGGTLPR